MGAGMSLSGLIREAAARDMGGLECLAGIPATIGGALVKNAGTRDGSILDFCTAIYYVNPDGTFGEYRPMAQTTAPFDLPPGRHPRGLPAAPGPAARRGRSSAPSSSA